MRKYLKYFVAAGCVIAIVFLFITIAYTLMRDKMWVRRGKQGTQGNHIAPVISDPHVKVERKLNVIAAQLDAITTQNVHGTLGGKVPAHLTDVEWTLFADAIYMKTSEDGLDFAFENKSKPSFGESIVDLDNEHLRSHWNWGFRLGGGYTFGQCDEWDVLLQWTNYHTHASGKESTRDMGSNLLLPAWYPAILGASATYANARWKLHYNIFDVELGRDYFISKQITLRPHVGVRGAWINQDYDVKYNGNIPVSGTTINRPTEMNASNDFDGGGLRAGAQFAWHFYNYRFSIFGKFSSSLIYGQFDIHQDFRTFNTTGGLDDLIPAKVYAKRREMKVRPNIEAGLGLQYETYTRSKDHVYVTLAYELFEWFQQNELQTFTTLESPFNRAPTTGLTSQREDGDLGMQGLTLRVRVDF